MGSLRFPTTEGRCQYTLCASLTEGGGTTVRTGVLDGPYPEGVLMSAESSGLQKNGKIAVSRNLVYSGGCRHPPLRPIRQFHCRDNPCGCPFAGCCGRGRCPHRPAGRILRTMGGRPYYSVTTKTIGLKRARLQRTDSTTGCRGGGHRHVARRGCAAESSNFYYSPRKNDTSI